MTVNSLEGAWSVDASASRACFSVRDKLLTTAHGCLPVTGGRAVVGADGSVITAELELSVAGLDTGNRRRDSHLRTPGFLDAQAFPTIRVQLAPSQAGSGSTWVGPGVLTARGRQAPLDLTAELTRRPGPTASIEDATSVRVRVTGRLDRRPLQIKAPTFVVGRVVDIDADLTFSRTGP